MSDYGDIEEDARYDDYIDSLFQSFLEDHGPEIREEAIADFTKERLQSYYRGDPDVAKASLLRLEEARALLPGHPSAALVMAGSAMEVGLKVALLKPIVFGVVHQDWVAEGIAELAIKPVGLDRFKNLLSPILAEYAGKDPLVHKRPGSSRTLWEEILEVQQNRNAVIHRAEAGTVQQAEQAVATAWEILETILPAVVDALGFRLAGGQILPK